MNHNLAQYSKRRWSPEDGGWAHNKYSARRVNMLLIKGRKEKGKIKKEKKMAQMCQKGKEKLKRTSETEVVKKQEVKKSEGRK